MHWLIIRLGNGDIAIGHGTVGKDIPCLTLQLMKEAKEIGSNVPTDAKIKDAEQICIAFTKLESLNVLEQQIALLKDKYFRGPKS